MIYTRLSASRFARIHVSVRHQRNLHWFLIGWFLLGSLFVSSPVRAQRDLQEIPDPDPAKELASFRVLSGCRVNLYVADPDIAKPIHMNFDAEGRLWIASSSVYPHLKPGQKANDKILVVEDRDRDGVAETTTVFADGLLIPTGVLPGDGGCYVANSTELLHLSDTDGDGKADRRRVVLSGFGAEDTHHLLHTLRWGPDGAMYMNQSIYIHSHIETPWGVRHLNGGGIWRFEPRRMKLEIFARGFINPWGHHFDRWGQSFVTDGAYREGINYVFPGAVFVTAPGATRTLRGLNPGSPKHCGLEILSGRHIPPEWQGLMVTNDFRGNRTCRFDVREQGSGYRSRQLEELIVTSHVAYRPVDVKMGPDGALYIADWYNPIIQHGEVDFRDPRRDHSHGRIWRVTFPDRPLVSPPKIVGEPIESLLELLRAPEDWVRLFAKLELKTRPPEKVAGAIREWASQFDTRSADDAHLLLEALWASQAIGRIDSDLLGDLLKSPEPRARAAAVRVFRYSEPDVATALATLGEAVRDPFPRVRLEAVSALAEVPDARAADVALKALDAPLDRFLDFALWNTMRQTAPYWLDRLDQLEFSRDRRRLLFALESLESARAAQILLKRFTREQWTGADRERAVRAIARFGSPADVGRLVQTLAKQPKLPAPALAGLLEILANETSPRRMHPPGVAEALVDLIGSRHVELVRAALSCGAAWGVAAVSDAAVTRARDRLAPDAVRQAAVRAIAQGDRKDKRTLLRQLASDSRAAVRWQAIAELVRLAPAVAAELAAAELARLKAPDDPALLIGLFRQRPQAIERLAASVANQKLDPDVARRAARLAAQEGPAGQRLRAALVQAGGLQQRSWKLTPELQRELVEEVARKGNAARGERIYHRAGLQCVQCHAIAGVGGVVGPDLVSIGASAPVDYLVEAVLDPNAKIKEGYHSVTVLDVDGRVHTGIPVKRTERELVLRDAQGKLIRLPIDAIEAEREGRSLMPEGALNELTRAELVDLVRFLSELGKPGPYAAPSPAIARRYAVLQATREAVHRLNRTSFDTAATDDPALTWTPVYAYHSGDLPLVGLPQLKPHRETPPTTFLRCELEVAEAGLVPLEWNDTNGIQVWVDGKPTPLEQTRKLELSAGRHRITMAIDRSVRNAPLRLQLGKEVGSRARWVLDGS